MATIQFTDEIADTLAEEHVADEKSAALITLSDRWTGDLDVDIIPRERGTVMLLARILRDDMDIAIGSQLTPAEGDEFADALREAAGVLQESSK